MSRTDLLILPGFNSFSISLSIVDMFIVAYLQETIGPDTVYQTFHRPSHDMAQIRPGLARLTLL